MKQPDRPAHPALGFFKIDVLGRGIPTYRASPSSARTVRTTWISTDYSLQLSGALIAWEQWQRHVRLEGTQRRFEARLPAR